MFIQIRYFMKRPTQFELFAQARENNAALSRKERTKQRDNALKDFYHDLYNKGLRRDWALTQTAQQFNLSEFHTERIIIGYVKRT